MKTWLSGMSGVTIYMSEMVCVVCCDFVCVLYMIEDSFGARFAA